jgi:hypothetical protein
LKADSGSFLGLTGMDWLPKRGCGGAAPSSANSSASEREGLSTRRPRAACDCCRCWVRLSMLLDLGGAARIKETAVVGTDDAVGVVAEAGDVLVSAGVGVGERPASRGSEGGVEDGEERVRETPRR